MLASAETRGAELQGRLDQAVDANQALQRELEAQRALNAELRAKSLGDADVINDMKAYGPRVSCLLGANAIFRRIQAADDQGKTAQQALEQELTHALKQLQRAQANIEVMRLQERTVVGQFRT